MKPIEEITSKDLEEIKLVVFDVDGVLVPRGTKIKQDGYITILETKVIADKQINQLRKLKEQGFNLNISSGRGLYMLQDMFGQVLEYTSLTYENGSATWIDGQIIQHVNSFNYMKGLRKKLQCDDIVKDKNFKGFEPKELIITIHCEDEISKIPYLVDEHNKSIKSTQKELYCLWNGEAYDIGVKEIQTKAVGLTNLIKYLGLEKKNSLAIGDNLNDVDLLAQAGISVTADKERVKGDFYVPLLGEKLPADVLIDCILANKISKI